MPSGGYRTGTPGTAYPQRTDLQQVAMPTPDTGTYGQAAAQRRSLQQVPAGIPKMAPFNRPTEDPSEHVMSGVSIGAGPGAEALAPIPGQNNQTPTQADLTNMARVLPALEALADLPDTSDTFRTYVRQLRGQARNV
jgi:hypothetical protein